MEDIFKAYFDKDGNIKESDQVILDNMKKAGHELKVTEHTTAYNVYAAVDDNEEG